MLLAHKIELRPTDKQEQFLFQSVGVRRFTYNALLAHFNQDGIKWSKQAANSKLKELKLEHAWMQGVSRTTDICDSCPIKWEDGVCDYKYQRWHNASSKSDRKMYAKTILKEIKENRKNK